MSGQAEHGTCPTGHHEAMEAGTKDRKGQLGGTHGHHQAFIRDHLSGSHEM